MIPMNQYGGMPQAPGDVGGAMPQAPGGGGGGMLMGMMDKLKMMNPQKRALLLSMLAKRMQGGQGQAPQQPQMTPYQPSAAGQFGMMPPMQG